MYLPPGFLLRQEAEIATVSAFHAVPTVFKAPALVTSRWRSDVFWSLLQAISVVKQSLVELLTFGPILSALFGNAKL
jgi:hypothetical protein